MSLGKNGKRTGKQDSKRTSPLSAIFNSFIKWEEMWQNTMHILGGRSMSIFYSILCHIVFLSGFWTVSKKKKSNTNTIVVACNKIWVIIGFPSFGIKTRSGDLSEAFQGITSKPGSPCGHLCTETDATLRLGGLLRRVHKTHVDTEQVSPREERWARPLGSHQPAQEE